jgi:hypothetical protein
MNNSCEEKDMKITPPKKTTYIISVIIFVLGVLAALIQLPILSSINIWVVAIAFLLLAIANVTKGL